MPSKQIRGSNSVIRMIKRRDTLTEERNADISRLVDEEWDILRKEVDPEILKDIKRSTVVERAFNKPPLKWYMSMKCFDEADKANRRRLNGNKSVHKGK
jgi:hypothetical protein